MAKRKYKYTLHPPFYLNEYSWGGDSKEALSKAFKSENVGGTIGGIGGALTSMIGAGMKNAEIADTSDITNNIKSVGNQNFAGSTNDLLMSGWGSRSYADNVNYKDIRGGSNGQRLMSSLGAGISGAASGFQTAGPLGAIGGTILGLGSGIAGIFSGNKKARNKTNELNQQAALANQQALSNFGNSVGNVNTNTNLNLLSNFAAYGGYMNSLAKGGHTHGAAWNNGVTNFDNGNTHESNPNGGVMIGVDAEGIPNMVEEGEVRFEDYIFSNRLTVPKKISEQHKLGKNVTFAEAAKKVSKESDERPNDPISKAGLEVSMGLLTEAQEELKLKKEAAAFKKLIAKMSPEELAMLQQQSLMQQGASLEGMPLMDEEQIQLEDPLQLQMTSQDPNVFAGGGLTNLRYAPAVGAGIGAFSDLMGWTNKPDYSAADMIGKSTQNLSNVSFNPIGDKMEYKPLDRNFYLNLLHGLAGASRRGIENQSGGNRGQAMAGLLASDYNTTKSIGNLARSAEEYNANERHKVADFNRATNMFNTEGAFKADMANKSNEELRFRSISSQADLRNKADMMSSSARSANLTNLFDSIGDIGREEYTRNMVMSNPALYYTTKKDGTISYKNGYENLSDFEKAQVDKDIEAKKKKNTGANGGYITIKGK